METAPTETEPTETEPTVRRLAGAAVLLLTLALVVAGCVPSLAPRPAHRTPKTAAALGKSDLPVLGGGRPFLGVDLYALSNYPAAVVKSDGEQVLGYIKNVLKADAVGIVWNFYARNRFSDDVGATRNTLSARNVGILTKIAKRDGLLVEYRPLILVQGLQNPWEGLISPYPLAGWFGNYYNAELPYLRMAQKHGVREFVVATELQDLNSSSLWPSFFARVSHVYHGLISYTAWDGNYFGNSPGAVIQTATPELLPTKYVGMDMYWHMDLPASATSAEVTAAWEALFSKLPSSLLRRTAIDETGIQARAGAYPNPGDLGASGRRSERVQVNWFTAACATVQRYHLRGVFFWKVDLADNPAHPATSLSTFEGRKGAAAISECARILH
jgi:hypothetical protein